MANYLPNFTDLSGIENAMHAKETYHSPVLCTLISSCRSSNKSKQLVMRNPPHSFNEKGTLEDHLVLLCLRDPAYSSGADTGHFVPFRALLLHLSVSLPWEPFTYYLSQGKFVCIFHTCPLPKKVLHPFISFVFCGILHREGRR